LPAPDPEPLTPDKKMNHIAQLDIVAYLDNACGVDDAVRIAAHCASCETCRAELALLQSLHNAVRTTAYVEPSFGFTSRVMHEIVASPSSSTLSQLIRNVPAWLMTAGLAFVVVFSMLMPTSTHSSTTPSGVPQGIAATTGHASQSYTGMIRHVVDPVMPMFHGTYGIAIALLILSFTLYVLSENSARRAVAKR